MSILRWGEPTRGLGEMPSKHERCEPDYEGIIKSGRMALERNLNLRRAMDAYFLHSTVSDEVARMYGELHFEGRALSVQIDAAMTAQEKAGG